MKLSKSQYIRALQCPKMLWMDKFMPDKAVCNDNLEGIFETGNEVGNLARSYFGEYALMDFSFDKKQMIEDTEKYIYSGAKNIAEASFMWNDLFCSVDILHKNPYGWDIIEVKSSTHITPVYIEDMAFQYYVLKKSGLSITGIYNMHLNSEYVRRGRLELGRLFSIEDCTDIVLSKQEYVRTNIDNIRKFMAVADDMEPETILGLHCDKPYNCAYTDYCRRNLPHPNVFDIRSNMKGKRKYDLFNGGIVSFEDVIKSGARLSVNQQLQVEAEYYEKPPKINKKKIKECLDEFSYPLYFLDFETFQPAIPKFDGTKPYMQIPFQYSLHIQDCKGAEPEHREFLAKEGTDPRRSLAEKLCEDIPRDVCTLAYNMKFEKMIIKSLAEEFADLAPHLMNIYENIKDLMVPFEKKYYYDRAFEGSYSIKYVLPAMCPNAPELNYHNLDGIHNGGEAMAAFDGLEKRSPEEVAQIRKNLLAYCRLDTLAMVKILEKLDDIMLKYYKGLKQGDKIMYKGVYEGVDADKQSKKILILGESHHSKDGNGDFTTAGVIQHMKRCPTNDAFHFFHKVAKSCGAKFSCTEMEFEMFWNKVYFGNYIEDLCEIKTSTAKNLARDNRVLYNDNLFKFINEKNIDMVLVFSRLVYNSLPSFSESLKSNERQKNFDDGTLKVKSKRDWISHCVYLPDAAHKYTNVLLNKKVDFYGMRHPSARCGYNAENYSKFLHCLFV